MSHSFGKTSSERLMTCHPDLIAVARLAISRSNVDFLIVQGARTFEQQLEYFRHGKSKLDPRKESSLRRAKHVTGGGIRKLAEAFDIAIYHPNKETRQELLYDKASLCYVAGVIQCCAQELYDCGEIGHLIRWGGNWNKNGVILQDQTFQDLPHHEIYKPS